MNQSTATTRLDPGDAAPLREDAPRREATRRAAAAAALLALAIVGTATAGEPWIELQEATAERLVAESGVGAADPEEKDFAVGDLDGDGDDDLVVVRKQPFSSTGRRRNVLLMNERGVLVDRTADLAAASDVPGDLGFLTPTNDRDVALVDVDGDGLLDVVTATTLSAGEPKHIGHPRVYRNLGHDGGGAWLGLRHEDARIPQLLTDEGRPANPQFNAVAAGDVTGDGLPDLYFADTDLGGAGSPDLNDRLLVNLGDGFFFDASKALPEAMLVSGGATACAIADLNGDGLNDIVKCNVLTAPIGVIVLWNSPVGLLDLETVYTQAPTHVIVADLDDDGRLDLVVTDDGVDRHLVNAGNGPDGHADFVSATFPDTSGFGGDALAVDLDGDGARDVVITDIDFEIPGCSRETFFFRNDGTAPVSFTRRIPGGLDASDLTGVHDVAAIDLDANGTLDLVLGRCAGIAIWLNLPTAEIRFDYPFGRPELLIPGFETLFEVNLVGEGGAVVAPGTPTLHFSIDGGPEKQAPVVELMGIVHRVTLPAVACGSSVRWWLSAETTDGAVFVDPPGAPAERSVSVGAIGVEAWHVEAFEGAATGWSVASENLASGAWEIVEPIGTTHLGGPAAPDQDASDRGTRAFVTGNGAIGGPAGAADVDGGPTTLTSPRLDLSGGDARIGFALWHFCDDAETPTGDLLAVELSNDDGLTWLPLATSAGTGGGWDRATLIAGEHLAPSAAMRLRFVVADQPNDSITESGLDDFTVERFLCAASCATDLDGDGATGFPELLAVLAAWGPCGICPADLDDDGTVAFGDLLAILGAWGPCGP